MFRVIPRFRIAEERNPQWYSAMHKPVACILIKIDRLSQFRQRGKAGAGKAAKSQCRDGRYYG